MGSKTLPSTCYIIFDESYPFTLRVTGIKMERIFYLAILVIFLANGGTSLSVQDRTYRCAQFRDMNTMQRYETTKRLLLCLNCLNVGHWATNCPNTQKCPNCYKAHHTMLLRESSTPHTPILQRGARSCSHQSSDWSNFVVQSQHLGKG